MQYDPIKKVLGNVFNTSPIGRKIFYRLLDVILLRTWHIKKVIRSWAKSAKGNISVLDAGSGFGQYSYYLARKHPSWQIFGVDVKEDQIRECRDFFKNSGLTNAQFEQADLVTFDQTGKHHLVLSVDVMEHIEEDTVVFENLCKSLKPGGMLLISTPSDKGGSDVDHNHGVASPQSSFIDEHVRDGYNIDDIAAKLKDAGFSKVNAAYTYGWPGKISWKLSMKFPILMLNASKLFFIILPFYFLAIFWFVLILNFLDVRLKHSTGTGLLVKAWK